MIILLHLNGNIITSCGNNLASCGNNLASCGNSTDMALPQEYQYLLGF